MTFFPSDSSGPKSPPPNPATLAGLNDVAVGSPAVGDSLRFNGEAWENVSDDVRGQHFRKHLTADRPLESSKPTSIRWDSDHDRITIPTSGFWMVTGQVGWDINPNGIRAAELVVNESALIAQARQDAHGSAGASIQVVGMYYFQAGDTVRLVAYQNSGSFINMLSGLGGKTWIAGALMRR